MSTTVYLGDVPFVIPDQGANPKDSFWGQNISEWIIEASQRINAFATLVFDTTQTVTNGATNVPLISLSFDPTQFRVVEITFAIKRDTAYEAGKMILVSNGVSWDFSLEYFGQPPTDVVLDVVSNDVVYSTSVIAAGTSEIRYKASGIETAT